MKLFKKILFYIRKILFKNFREKQLINVLYNEIKALCEKNNFKDVRILDYGSGRQPIVIFELIKKLNNDKKYLFQADCYDFYDVKDLQSLNKISKCINFYSINKFNDKKQYEFVLIIDVLHHINLDEFSKVLKIVNNLKMISKYLIIKDHFEFGFISNFLLRVMDFIGNYFNDVYIPRKYFTKDSYAIFLSKVNISEIKRITDVNYHKSYWIFFSRKKFHFISILLNK